MHQPLRGYTVFGAHSREEALEALRQKLADVVILDVTKPGLDGLGTLEELRRFSKTGAHPHRLRPRGPKGAWPVAGR
jgi:DNA-binding response OmpR family regulator